MQGNDTNIIVVTVEVKEFWLSFACGSENVGGKSLDMFSRFKDFMEENSFETVALKLTSVSDIAWLM
jgi:hypothetical protein